MRLAAYDAFYGEGDSKAIRVIYAPELPIQNTRSRHGRKVGMRGKLMMCASGSYGINPTYGEGESKATRGYMRFVATGKNAHKSHGRKVGMRRKRACDITSISAFADAGAKRATRRRREQAIRVIYASCSYRRRTPTTVMGGRWA